MPDRAIRVIGDDMTGAVGSPAGFRFAGWITELEVRSRTQSVVVVTGVSICSRRARGSVDMGVRGGSGFDASWRTYFKVDSGARGLTGRYVRDIQRFVNGRQLVVCKAAPRRHRTVRDGQLLVAGVPADCSDVGEYAECGAGSVSALPTLVDANTPLGLAEIRSGRVSALLSIERAAGLAPCW